MCTGSMCDEKKWGYGTCKTISHQLFADSANNEYFCMNQHQYMENIHEEHKALHLILGEVGEELAANWLMKNDYRIWHRNWRSKYGYELDIVAFKDNLIHVVEVKTRSNDDYTEPYTALTLKKLRRVQIGAGIYKRYYKLDFDYVIDGITILYHDEQHYDLQFIPNIHTQLRTTRFYT